MQVLDSLIDGMEALPDERDQKDFIWGVVMVMRTGEVPDRLRPVSLAMLRSSLPPILNSRARALAGAKGGSKQPSKAASKREANPEANGQANAKQTDKQNGKQTPSEEEEEEERDKNPLKPPKGGGKERVPWDVIEEAVAYLNAKTGSSYRPKAQKTVRAITARVKEGYGVEDFRAVVDSQCAEWLGDPKMAKFLRPETLFGTKMDGYLGAPKAKEAGAHSQEAHDLAKRIGVSVEEAELYLGGGDAEPA